MIACANGGEEMKGGGDIGSDHTAAPVCKLKPAKTGGYAVQTCRQVVSGMIGPSAPDLIKKRASAACAYTPTGDVMGFMTVNR
jgi:hypothetical protein